jgi:hypothetical protein
MAPFDTCGRRRGTGSSPFTIAIIIAAYLLVRLFNYTIGSVAFPAACCDVLH